MRGAGGTESVDEIVIVAQPGDRLDEHVVEDDLLVDRHTATLDVLEDLATVVVKSVQLGNAAQTVVVQVGQQLVDRRCPRPGRTTHGAADARRTADRTGKVLRIPFGCRVARFHRGTFALALLSP